MHSSRTDRGSLLVFAMVALAAALVISGSAGTVSSVPPPSSPSTPPPATAQLSVTPSSVSVNSTVGVMGSQSVTASNTGTAALTVSQVQISGTGFALSGITAPVSLTPAQSQSFSVTFDSSTTGTVTGKLTLMTSAADERAGSASLISPAAAGTTWAFASPATGRNSAASRWRRSTSTVGAKSGASSAVSGSGKR